MPWKKLGELYFTFDKNLSFDEFGLENSIPKALEVCINMRFLKFNKPFLSSIDF